MATDKSIISRKNNTNYPRDPRYLGIAYEDWKAIKDCARTIDLRPARWENWVLSLLASAIGFFTVYITGRDYSNVFLYLFFFGGILTIIFSFAAFIYSKKKDISQTKYLDKIKEIEYKFDNIKQNDRKFLYSWKILDSYYGATLKLNNGKNIKQGIEVTKELKNKIRKNRLHIKVSEINNEIKKDPFPGKKKILWIKYLLDGEEKNATAFEDQIIDLP